MSDDIQDAPETPEVAPLVPTPDGGQRIADPRERALKALLAKRIDEPVVAPEVAPPVVEAKPVEPPKEAGPSKQEAKLLAELQKRERAAYEASEKAKSLEEQLAQLRESDAKRRNGSPLDVLKELGMSYEDLTRGIVEGKYKPQSNEALAIDATKSEVQQLREQLEALQSERADAERMQTMSAKVAAISEKLALPEVTGQIPVLASLAWAPQHLADYHAENPDEDLDAYAVELDKRARADIVSSLSSEHAIKVLLSDDSLKTKVLVALGVTKHATQDSPQASQGTSLGNGPAAIPPSAAHATASRKTPSKAVTDGERKAAALRAVLARRESRAQ